MTPAAPERAGGERTSSHVEISRVEPVFRVIEPGEQRLEGTLDRISCPATKAVIFHVRTAAGSETLQASKFEEVDFISYREDLSGQITCGPLKEPRRVYVTWRPGATPNVRTVVAIEFLPK